MGLRSSILRPAVGFCSCHCKLWRVKGGLAGRGVGEGDLGWVGAPGQHAATQCSNAECSVRKIAMRASQALLTSSYWWLSGELQPDRTVELALPAADLVLTSLVSKLRGTWPS